MTEHEGWKSINKCDEMLKLHPILITCFYYSEELITAAFFMGISGSSSTIINFATETALTIEEITDALETVELNDDATFDEIVYTGDIETVMRKVDLQSVTFVQTVTAELFESVTEVFQATWEEQFPGKWRSSTT